MLSSHLYSEVRDPYCCSLDTRFARIAVTSINSSGACLSLTPWKTIGTRRTWRALGSWFTRNTQISLFTLRQWGRNSFTIINFDLRQKILSGGVYRSWTHRISNWSFISSHSLTSNKTLSIKNTMFLTTCIKYCIVWTQNHTHSWSSCACWASTSSRSLCSLCTLCARRTCRASRSRKPLCV